ncbi:MAG: hypothetical protein PHF64_07420 [Methanoregula sp.]|nr:hypothetical protein [Methanoregula sp.]
MIVTVFGEPGFSSQKLRVPIISSTIVEELLKSCWDVEAEPSRC